MAKRAVVKILSAMGENKYELDPARLLRLTEFAANLQMEQDRPGDKTPAAAGEPPAQKEQAGEMIGPAAWRTREEAAQTRTRAVQDTDAPRQRGNLDEGPYTGFLLIKCAACGEVSGFNAKRPIYASRCKKCGGETLLEKLRMAYLNCGCGKSYSYKTNIQEAEFEYPCLACGKPIRVQLNWRGTAYVPTEPAARKGGWEK